jgi:hypothetical protein
MLKDQHISRRARAAPTRRHGHTPMPPLWSLSKSAARKLLGKRKPAKTRRRRPNSALTKMYRCKKCLLVSKRQADSTAKNSNVACGDGETGHHLIEAHGFTVKGSNRTEALSQFANYKEAGAPCVCAQWPRDGAGRYEGDHGFLHAAQGIQEQATIEAAPAGSRDYAWAYGQARAASVRAHQQTFNKSKCWKKCLKAQLDSYHNGIVAGDDTPVRTEAPNLTDSQKALAHEMVPEVTLSKW